MAVNVLTSLTCLPLILGVYNLKIGTEMFFSFEAQCFRINFRTILILVYVM